MTDDFAGEDRVVIEVTPDDLYHEIDHAVLMEREACASLVGNFVLDECQWDTGRVVLLLGRVARAIRARKQLFTPEVTS